ncbi:MbnP family protein [Botryobacter ruber]|uniref:MbnP family protein n=1 Tax=Botryobacter ruber TaxID=2171629 RepID=UPI000E0A8826|nr:MbnP family protein [Botryobacter ruber]
MRKLLTFLVLPFFSLLLLACENEPAAPEVDYTLQLAYEVDGEPVLPETMQYTTQSGYRYSISKLEYYISDIRLIAADGKIKPVVGVHYVNFLDNSTSLIRLPDDASGTYTSLTCNIGIGPDMNKTAALPNTLANANMAWPDQMGGGYHFLKLEGTYEAGNGAGVKGYAMHLGKNENLVKVTLAKDFRLDKNRPQFKLVMNVNEWFSNPRAIDFEVDGTFSMYDQQYMQKLVLNGATVFKFADEND